MRTSFFRAAAVAAVLIAALPAVAGAAVDDYAAEASTSAVKISAFEEAVGSPLLDLVSTDAFAASDPVASASVGILEILGTEVFAVTEANSEGEPVRDPEDKADDCQLPVSAPGLTLDAVCASAEADAGASDEASANADTDLLQVEVNGSLLAGLLTEPLTDFVAVLTDGATDDAIAAFTDACNELLAELPDDSDEIPNTVGDLIDELPEEFEAITDPIQEVLDVAAGDNPCAAIIRLTLTDVVPPAITLEAIADALDGVNLVDLSIDGAKSDVAGDDAALTSTATQAFVNLTGPGLDELDLPGIIMALLNGVEDEIEAAIEEVAGLEVPDGIDISDAVQQIVDALPEFGTEPLIRATVSGGRADATLDNDDASTTSGGEAPYVEVTFAPGILALLGQEAMATQRFEAGQSQTIAEGTPLESTISVGGLTTEDDVEFPDSGLTGSTASASATEVSLLNLPEAGGIDIVLAASDAGVYGSLVTAGSAPPPGEDDPLPNTGGGAALAAALALGAALVMRRRRD